MQWVPRRCGVFAAISALVACACGGGPRRCGTSEISPPAAEAAAAPAAAVRRVGRFEVASPSKGDRQEVVRFAWSGSSFVFRVQAASVAMRLQAAPLRPHEVMEDGKVVAIHENTTPYSVFVDDQPPVLVQVSAGRERYELAAGLDVARPHDIRVVREAEAFAGVHELVGIDVAPGGKLLAPRVVARRIEVIGDSISCGYGVLGENAACHFTFATERATAAYPGLLARALDADVTNLCWSGKGVLRNFDGSTQRTMPELFDTAVPPIPTDDTNERFTPAKPWDFARAAAPDVVIVNLGTNDFLGGAGRPLDLAAFEEAYVAFLRRIRAVYPAAWLFVTTSAMMHDVPPAFGRVVSRRTSDGDTRIELVVLPSDAPHWGCDSHPDAELNVRIAARLAAVVNSRLADPRADPRAQ